MPAPQYRYWILTIPHHLYTPFLPPELSYVKGQLELSNTTGYCHWQLLAHTKRKITLSAIKKLFGSQSHAEPTRSEAASSYVWKEDTRVPNTQFELGQLPFHRNNPKDWEAILNNAKNGNLLDIPPDVLVRYYNSIRRIEKDNLQPISIQREVFVYWGRTGAGKSRRAWDEATFNAYPKDPNTKFWDGYRNHEFVVIDEFRGGKSLSPLFCIILIILLIIGIAINHLLRWFDRYPVIIEQKGSACVLVAKKIWITSNLSPNDWYPDLDQETLAALRRRLNITHFN